MTALVREHAPVVENGATARGANAVIRLGQGSHHYDPIAYVARKLWPTKTSEHLADYLGCSVRHAKYLLSPRTSKKTITVAFIKRMLLGRHGHEFLKAWMDQSDAEWWQRLVDLEERQIENEKRLSEINEVIRRR